MIAISVPFATSAEPLPASSLLLWTALPYVCFAVLVVGLVAADAGARRLAVHGRAVAGLAVDPRMAPGEREARARVVEGGDAPVRRPVAGLAALALLVSVADSQPANS